MKFNKNILKNRFQFLINLISVHYSNTSLVTLICVFLF